MISLCHDVHTNAQQKELRSPAAGGFDLDAYEGIIQPGPFGGIAVHWHEQWEIFLLLHGSVRIAVGDECCTLQAGEALFINGGALHSFACAANEACRYRSFVFGSEVIGGMPGSVFDMRYVRPVQQSGVSHIRFVPEKEPEFFQSFAAAFEACAREAPGYEFTVREALSCIALLLLQKSAAPARRTAPAREERLKKMLQWAGQNLEKELQVQHLAAAANICTRECQRIFAQYLHQSPMDYVRRQRILRAAQLLAETRLPITEIALQCGFSGPSYFASQFKSLVGQTPQAYRRQAVCAESPKSITVHTSGETPAASCPRAQKTNG